MQTPDENRKHCHDEILHCIGTASVYALRVRRIRRRIQFLSFLGIAVPASVGAAVASFGIASHATTVFIAVAGVLSIAQVLLSVWSLSTAWSDQLAVALEGQTANRDVAEAFQSALRDNDDATLKPESDRIDVRNRLRSREDEKQGFTENETRAGMRHALRELKRECEGCGKVPVSLESTDCDVCGRFKIARI